MLTRDFDFELPESSIAQEALPRGQSRLFVIDAEAEQRHRSVTDLKELLRPGDLLVLNDTKVIPARLYGRRAGGGRSEVLLLEKIGPKLWQALARPLKKLKPGTTLQLEPLESGMQAEIVERLDEGRVIIRFDREIEPHLETIGHVPLPPYIRRKDQQKPGSQGSDSSEEDDRQRYQTVYARAEGAVAAPTAGLHFDAKLLAELESAGVERATLTLHVGIGTFKPVSADDVHEHRMEEERYLVAPEVADAVRRTRERGGRVVAVGTTVVRTLESVACPDGTIETGAGRTRLFITPGFHFRAVDVLLTNFHLPRSTLLMLVSAFAGRERVLAAYEEAVDHGYRFYSYGDAMLLERRAPLESQNS